MDMYMQRMEEQGWRSVYSWPILLTPVLLHRSHCTSTDTEGMDESSSTLTEATRIAARCELFFSLLYCAPSLCSSDVFPVFTMLPGVHYFITFHDAFPCPFIPSDSNDSAVTRDENEYSRFNGTNLEIVSSSFVCEIRLPWIHPIPKVLHVRARKFWIKIA